MSKYQLELVSDERMLRNSVIKYQYSDLVVPNRALDSTLFGATITKQKRCLVCNGTLENCPSHYSVIEIPIPIIKSICTAECLKLIPCLCPACSHIILPDQELDEIRKINREKRFGRVVEAVKKIKSKATSLIECPYCHNSMPSTIEIYDKYRYKFVPIFQIKNPRTSEFEIMNPVYVMQVLQNFTQIDEIGYSEQFHPKNFMTNYIPIIPTKLRAKSLINGTETTSALTSYYKLILENAIPILTEIKNYSIDKSAVNAILIDKSKIDSFLDGYTKLQAYYMLITDVGSDSTAEQLLNILQKNYKNNYDASNCLIRKFKGKNKSIFNRGMLGLVHDVSSRVVLGAGEDASMQDIFVPLTIANKLLINYPVYRENIEFMRTLILAMTNNEVYSNPFIPKVLGITPKKTKKFQRFSLTKAEVFAQLLEPGDKVGISLCNHDFVIQNRHPSIREECLTSFQVQKSEFSTVGIPLPVCEIKQADFDGDEIQLYMCSGHYTDIESLLLHSVYAQLKSFCDGGLSFYYNGSHDNDLGVSRIADININYFNHEKCESTNVLELISRTLPKNLNYHSSSLVIENGKIDKDKCNFKSKEFYKYYASEFGEDKCTNLIDTLIQIGYCINRVYGTTLGFEIKLWCNDDEVKNIKEMKEKAIAKSSEIIKLNGKPSYESMNCFEEIQPSIKKVLVESAAGQNFDKMGYTGKRSTEYYAMVINPPHVQIDGEPVAPTIAEGTRTNFGGYKYSFDPRDYGFVDRGYVDDISPYSHFFIMMEEWKAIYIRTTGVAKQGYMTNKMTVLFERAFVDCNGCLVDGTTHLSNQYGPCGLDSRLEVLLTLPDIDLSINDFNHKYSDKKLQSLHTELLNIRNQYKQISAFIKQETRNIFVTGFDFYQVFTKEYEGVTEQKEIDKFIEEMYEIFVPKILHDNYLKLTENFKSHEYFFRIILTKYKLNEELKHSIFDIIRCMLANAGDPVGVKAALACSAPLTQSALSAIHNANAGGLSIDLVRRPDGMESFMELLSGSSMKDLTVLTIVLNNDDEKSTRQFALEQETFYYNEIWAMNEIHISKSIPSNLLKIYGEDVGKLKRHNYYVISIWNMVRLSGYGVKITDIINELMSNYDEIKFMLPYFLNKTQVKVYIYFNEKVQVQRIYQIVEEWKKVVNKNIVHGRYLKNCFVVENINNPGHYLIEANEANMENKALSKIIYDPRINPTLCKTSNPRDSIKMFGIFEGECRHYEQLMFTAQNLSSTKELNGRNYSTVAAIQTANGKLTFVDALSMIKSKYGEFLKKCKFERANIFIKDHLQRGNMETVNEFTSANVFGDLPRLGSTVSDYVLMVD